MTRLLLRGIKTFWKTKSYLEVAIFEFPEHSVYEVITYDPTIQTHTNHLYIDGFAVHSILKSFGSNRTSLSSDELVTTFLFNHIVLTEYLPQTKSIQIDFRIYGHEIKCAQDMVFVIKKPYYLPIIKSPFCRESISMGSEAREVRLSISLRDKWRLPLILVRVSKSLPLHESDAKTWACFVHNKTNTELVELTAVALSARIFNVNKDILRSIAHSLLLPQNCPFPGSPQQGDEVTPMSLTERCSTGSMMRISKRTIPVAVSDDQDTTDVHRLRRVRSFGNIDILPLLLAPVRLLFCLSWPAPSHRVTPLVVNTTHYGEYDEKEDNEEDTLDVTPAGCSLKKQSSVKTSCRQHGQEQIESSIPLVGLEDDSYGSCSVKTLVAGWRNEAQKWSYNHLPLLFTTNIRVHSTNTTTDTIALSER